MSKHYIRHSTGVLNRSYLGFSWNLKHAYVVMCIRMKIFSHHKYQLVQCEGDSQTLVVTSTLKSKISQLKEIKKWHVYDRDFCGCQNFKKGIPNINSAFLRHCSDLGSCE